VFDLNPDGFAANTRQNGRAVDLNRNFPYGWRPLGPPGSISYAGPVPASEPETRIAIGLIDRTRPTISIWFHQHLDLVDESGGDLGVELRFARMVGLRVRRLPRYPGSVAAWENHRFPGTTAFIVELPAGSLVFRDAKRFADAILALVRSGPGKARFK
jgi:protein MpaA